jgi:hypothetical protein
MQVSRRQTTRPADFVYGVLGLVSPAICSAIHIDYDQPPAMIWADAMKIALSKTSPENICNVWHAFRDTPRETDGLPSWCPDFVQQSMASFGRPPLTERYLLPPWSGTCDSVQINDSSNAITIPGIIKDSVKASATICLTGNIALVLRERTPGSSYDIINTFKGEASHRRQWFHEMRTIFASKDERRTIFESFLEQFIKTLVEEFMPKGNDLPSKARGEPIRLFQELERLCEQLVTTLDVDSMHAWEKADFYSLLPPLTIVDRENARRYFFATRDGRMGFAAKPVQEGQKICFIPGGRQLYVLDKDCKRYIAEAAVEGLMDYKALGSKSLFNRPPKFQKITLY